MSARIMCNCGSKPPANKPRRAKAFVRDPDGKLRPVCSGCRPDQRRFHGDHGRSSVGRTVSLKAGHDEYVVQIVMTG